MRPRHIGLLAAVAAAAGLGVAWLLLLPGGISSESARTPGHSERSSGSATADPRFAAIGQATPGDGDRTDPFLTQDLHLRLEDVLLEAGEAGTPAALKQKLAALVPRFFSSRDAVRALALLERYVDYRVALGEIEPLADPGDPHALRGALAARRRLREKHFSAEEYRALFGEEEELDRFTLARLEIERNRELTPAQQAAAVRDAERELSEPQRTLRSEATAHVALAAQTAAFEAAGTSDQERFERRRAQFGDAASAQLAQLDREEREWQARLDEYAATQARNAPQEELQRLRQQLFTPQEQLRVAAALALRRQGTPLEARQ